jgi:hypothetical protein
MNDLEIRIFLRAPEIIEEIVASSGALVRVRNRARCSVGIASSACGGGILDDSRIGKVALEIKEDAGSRWAGCVFVIGDSVRGRCARLLTGFEGSREGECREEI